MNDPATLVFDFTVGQVLLRLPSGELVPAPDDYVLGAEPATPDETGTS
jgi:hypothetical protein